MSYNIRKLYRMIGDFVNQKRTGTDDEARTLSYLSNNLILRVQQGRNRRNKQTDRLNTIKGIASIDKKKKKNTRVVARSANDLIFVIVDKSFTRQHVRGNS